MIQPKGEKVRQAVKWISNRLDGEDTKQLSVLIEEASKEFNLSPLEEDFLVNFFKQTKSPTKDS